MSVTTNQLMDLGWPPIAAKNFVRDAPEEEKERLADDHAQWVACKGAVDLYEGDRRRRFLQNLEALCLRYGYTIESRFEGGVELMTSFTRANVEHFLKELGG